MSWHLLLSPFYHLTELEAEAEVDANSTFIGNPLKDRIFCIDQIFGDLHKAISNVHKFQHLIYYLSSFIFVFVNGQYASTYPAPIPLINKSPYFNIWITSDDGLTMPGGSGLYFIVDL